MAVSVTYYIGLEQTRRKQGQHVSFQKGKHRHVSKNTITKSDLTRGVHKKSDMNKESLTEFIRRVLKKKEE